MTTTYRKVAHAVGWALCLNGTSLTATIASAAAYQPPLTIEAPAATSYTDTVPLQLEMRPGVVARSLRMRLNGKPLNTLKGTLTEADGLTRGRNTLVVTATNEDRSLDAQTVAFDYTPRATLLGASDSEGYMPTSVGLTVSRGGTLPWVQITTGWQQPAAPDTYPHASYDQSFPTSTDTACAATDVYQVLVLNRATPTTEIAYKCFAKDSDLTTYLRTLTANELVIAGTTANHNATPSLDTTAIGGSSYANAQAAFTALAKPSGQAPKDLSYSGNVFQLLEGYTPLSYVTIGAGGSTPGTAYESYYTTSDTLPKTTIVGTDAVDINPHATGTLNYDVNGNYNFVSGEAQPLQVTPGDPAIVTLGTTTYSSSQAQGSYHNGFFLLIADRLTLAPVNWNVATTGPLCRATQNPTPNSCGVFYPTGEAGVSAAAVQNLTAALQGVNPRQVAILTTVGAAFTSNSDLSPDLATALQQMGATYYTMRNLTASSTNFTFVANGPDPKTLLLTGNVTSAFAKGVVEESNQFAQQGQTGNLWGLFARDVSGLYYVLESSSSDASAEADFHQISTAPNGDWPMTDTAAHIAAYHYISNQYLTTYPLHKTGAYAYDLREWYPDNTDHVEDQNVFFAGECPSNVTTTDFTSADYCDVWTQLKAELRAVSSVRALLGNDGLRGTVTSVGMNDAITASYTIGENQFTVTPTNHVYQRTSNWFRMAAGATAGFSMADPMFGVMAAALNVGATGYAMAALKTNPAQFETGFDVLLGNTSAYESTLRSRLPVSYDTAIDTIYSDWTKLQTIAAKHDDTNSAWQIPNGVVSDGISAAIGMGATRSLYIQTVPNYYSLDTYPSVPIDSLSKLGMYYTYLEDNFTNKFTCTASYQADLSTEAYAIYPSLGPPSTNNDMFVIGGTIDNQDNSKVKEAMPSQSLLDELFSQSNLNLPADMLLTNNGLFAVRNGPQMQATDPQCYTPPCGSMDSTACVGP